MRDTPIDLLKDFGAGACSNGTGIILYEGGRTVFFPGKNGLGPSVFSPGFGPAGPYVHYPAQIESIFSEEVIKTGVIVPDRS